VYCKKPLASGKPVLNYLSQYTHKIAINNSRIVAINDSEVSFAWKDYSDGNKKRVTTINRIELVRRYLLHVLPLGFMRIRHFGFLGSRYKQKNLDLIRRILKAAPVIKEVKKKEDYVGLMKRLTGKDLNVCKGCKQGRMEFYTDIPKFWILAPDK